MIPNFSNIQEVEIESYVDRTYQIDFSSKRVIGMVDGLKATEQAIYKIFNTERYAFSIYDGDYGIELESLIGQSESFIRTVLPKNINDAIMSDERVTKVESVTIEKINHESLHIVCIIETIHGSITIESELIL